MTKYLPHYEDCAAQNLAVGALSATALTSTSVSATSVSAASIAATTRIDTPLLAHTPGAYEDITFPSTGVNPPGAASDPTRSTSTGLFVFSASATNIIVGVLQMRHSWQSGTAINPHIHWMPDTNNVGNVMWRFEYAVVGIGDTWDLATYTADTKTVAAGGVARVHKITAFDPVTITAGSLSCHVMWRLSRIGDDVADTFTGTAHLLDFDAHYQRDSMGSIEEYSKWG